MLSRLLCLLCLFAFSSAAFGQVTLDLYENGFSSPVSISNAGDARLFIVERAGKIKIIDENGNGLAIPFLDIDNLVISTGGQSEQGLLGLAFHPDYANNGYYFVHYTNNSGDSQISRFTVDANNPNFSNPSSEKEIMTVDQPFGNHNGGDLAFGPDGYLYIGFGDGGAGGDPGNRSQNLGIPLGKLLRVDVDVDGPYEIPADNPFVGNPNALDMIWAYGIRNPWRFNFDRMTGDLWMADVGQGNREEIDRQPAASTGGENYGWKCYEGNATFDTAGCPDVSELTAPVFDYDHAGFTHCSVTGGYVYRGCMNPDLTGSYFFADYCSGRMWSLTPDGSGGYTDNVVGNFSNFQISAFGEGSDGEIYVANMGNGSIYRLAGGNPFTAGAVTAMDNMLTAQAGFANYQWYLNGQIINGSTSVTHTATESGSYTVEVTNDSGCTATSAAVEVMIVNTFEVEHLNSLVVNPNPFSTKVNITVAFNDKGNYEIAIYDLAGKKYLSQKVEGSLSNQNFEFDLSDASDGVYLMKISNGKGEMSRKLVKVK